MFYIHSDFPHASGIYIILNTINNHRYIGSAVNLQNRLREHRRMLRNGTHKNPHLQAAFNLYGEDAFTTSVIELVEQKEHLLEREQFHLDTSQPEYNISKIVGSSNLGRVFSLEARKNMSKGQRKRKFTPLTEETKAKISAARKGKPHKGHKHSNATRAKLSAKRKGWVPSEATRLIWSAQRKGKIAPNSGQFKKGSIPANKGKRRSNAETS